jgi:hypothetical protein
LIVSLIFPKVYVVLSSVQVLRRKFWVTKFFIVKICRPFVTFCILVLRYFHHVLLSNILNSSVPYIHSLWKYNLNYTPQNFNFYLFRPQQEQLSWYSDTSDELGYRLNGIRVLAGEYSLLLRMHNVCDS